MWCCSWLWWWAMKRFSFCASTNYDSSVCVNDSRWNNFRVVSTPDIRVHRTKSTAKARVWQREREASERAMMENVKKITRQIRRKHIAQGLVKSGKCQPKCMRLSLWLRFLFSLRLKFHIVLTTCWTLVLKLFHALKHAFKMFYEVSTRPNICLKYGFSLSLNIMHFWIAFFSTWDFELIH